MKGRLWLGAVTLGSLAVLGFRLGSSGVASGLVDPVGGIRAQDEAVYSHSAIRMARHGDWLTPRLLDRYALYKPPLLLWLAGGSAKALGISAFSLRLPSLVAGALLAALVFAWGRAAHSAVAGTVAALLVVSNPLVHSLSRLNLTDALLALWIAAALCCLAADPQLSSRRARWGFAAATGLGIMTKAVAGLLPLFVLAGLAATARPDMRPPLKRVLQVVGITALVAAPWHLYQLAVHTRWFWAEYIQDELFLFGAGSPPQTSREHQVWFYLRRLLVTDPVLAALALAGLPALWRRRREARTLALIWWIAVVLAAVLLFRYRNVAYLAPLVPALALVAAVYGPFSGRRPQLALLACLVVVFGLRTQFPGRPWGLNYPAGGSAPSGAALDRYASWRRPHELIIVEPEDEFYSSLLPLERVRYCFIDPQDRPSERALDFHQLGILVTAAQFAEMDRHHETFAARLREWGLDTATPLATAIVARSAAEVRQMIRARPASDFFLPHRLLEDAAAVAAPGQSIVSAPPGRFFLLADAPPGRGGSPGPSRAQDPDSSGWPR